MNSARIVSNAFESATDGRNSRMSLNYLQPRIEACDEHYHLVSSETVHILHEPADGGEDAVAVAGRGTLTLRAPEEAAALKVAWSRRMLSMSKPESRVVVVVENSVACVGRRPDPGVTERKEKDECQCRQERTPDSTEDYDIAADKTSNVGTLTPFDHRTPCPSKGRNFGDRGRLNQRRACAAPGSMVLPQPLDAARRQAQSSWRFILT